MCNINTLNLLKINDNCYLSVVLQTISEKYATMCLSVRRSARTPRK